MAGSHAFAEDPVNNLTPGGVVVTRVAHNHEIAGAIPAPATTRTCPPLISEGMFLLGTPSSPLWDVRFSPRNLHSFSFATLIRSALTLRADSASVRDIERLLTVSRSSSSLWTRSIELTSEQRTRLQKNNVGAQVKAVEALRKIYRDRHAQIEKEARTLFLRYASSPSFLLGLGLYWVRDRRP